jgi:transcriptional regulator with XRE-family HTH domain
MSNTRAKQTAFGDLIRRRRRALDLTQEQVAARIQTSTQYVGHLETGKRHPSGKIVTRLAEVLFLDRLRLFFLANPAEALLSAQPDKEVASVSAWDQFIGNKQLRQMHNLTSGETEMLSRVAASWRRSVNAVGTS